METLPQIDANDEVIKRHDDFFDFPDLSSLQKKPDLTPYKEYQIRPDVENKFKSTFVKEEISDVLHELLSGVKYKEEEAPKLAKLISEKILSKLGCKRDSGKIYDKYKLVVNVVLGEYKGAGVKNVTRCFWDPEYDALVSEHFLSESLFCVATVYGILFY